MTAVKNADQTMIYRLQSLINLGAVWKSQRGLVLEWSREDTELLIRNLICTYLISVLIIIRPIQEEKKLHT